MSHSKQKGAKSSAEWHFWVFTGQPNSIFPYSHSIFYISHRNEVLNFFVLLCLRGSVQSPDAKRAQSRPYYVSLIEVKHEIKPASMIKRFNMFLRVLHLIFFGPKNEFLIFLIGT